MHIDSYRFEIDNPGWPAFLEAQGFVVLRRVVPDAPDFVAALWDLVEALGDGLDRRVAATQRRGRAWPTMLHGGMIQYVGHTAAQWALRERVAPAFARLHGCAADELASSFDGLCFMSGQRAYKPRGPLSILHTDQSPRRPARWSVQGLVNLVDNDDRAGGLCVVPRSHLAHAEFFRARGLDPAGDWYLFSDADKQGPLFRDVVKVCGEAGDLMLWDSRTFHGNTIPGAPVLRVCAYICMLPKRRVPAATVAKRAQAVAERRCSSHHPGDGFRMFPALPRHMTAAQRARTLERLPGLQPGPVGPLQRSLAHVEVAA
jgi:ectoine hydroxylase-related dioxygenase (phytanoyl-CoA dioxygenase family)